MHFKTKTMAKSKTPPAVVEKQQELTISKLSETGVKVSLNQNDLIEVMSDDLYTEIKNEISELNKGIPDDDYQERVKKEIEIFQKECLKKYPFITKEKLNVECYLSKSYQLTKTDISVKSSVLRTYNSNSGFHIREKHTEKFYLYKKAVLVFSAFDYDHNINLHIKKEIELQEYNRSDVLKYSLKVEAFYDKINMLLGDKKPQILDHFMFTPTSIQKILRTRMNKKIIKSQSPEVAEMLNKMFNTKF
jgi:hypothetical protein